MVIVKETKTLREYRAKFDGEKKTLGFVPTMGALHDGHISLVQKAKAENETCICSIFINPTQFNNAEDLALYPVTIEADIDLLEKNGCDILFLPTVNGMYPADEQKLHYNLGFLESILEGEFRPGHFQGVCMIVDKLLTAVKPSTVYLGRKDYQQCMVIAKMMKDRGHSAHLKICETVREADGLAMSSRNVRLTEAERDQAPDIIRALRNMKNTFTGNNSGEVTTEARLFLEKRGFKVDYTEIADAETLAPFQGGTGDRKAVALAAAWLNNVRLIDNIVL